MDSTLSDKKYPKVSVVVPAYNSENYIAEAIQSILDQNYPNTEILVINDGSTDNTMQVLQAFDGQVKVIEQVNSGSAVARSNGMQHSTGDYIAFLDSDDIWLPNKLESQVNFLESHAEFGMVFSNWSCWTPDDQGVFHRRNFSQDKKEDARPMSGWLFGQLIDDCIVWTSTVLMRREVFENIGQFDSTLRRGQDYDYWLRASTKYKIHKLDDIHAVYRIHDASVTRTPKPVNYEYIVISKAMKLLKAGVPGGENVALSTIEKRLSQISFDFAYQHFYQGNMWVAIKNLLNGIKHNPLKPKIWLYLGLGFLKLPFSLLHSTGGQKSR